MGNSCGSVSALGNERTTKITSAREGATHGCHQRHKLNLDPPDLYKNNLGQVAKVTGQDDGQNSDRSTQ